MLEILWKKYILLRSFKKGSYQIITINKRLLIFRNITTGRCENIHLYDDFKLQGKTLKCSFISSQYDIKYEDVIME